MDDCVFCRIGRGEIPADIVYKDDEVVAFRDINPQGPVHVVIIPVEHIPGIKEAEERHQGLVGKLMLVAARIAQDEGIADSGYRLVVNQGREAGQSVDHLHVHVIGGRAMHWPPG
jgi:histidine triad (HIT) family protein